MLPPSTCRRWALCALTIALAYQPVAASDAVDWLPAKTDIVLTLNVRQFLKDHERTDRVQQLLGPWRSALRSEALGVNPLEDVDRITCGFPRNSADAWVVVLEGRFDAERLRKAVQRMAGSFKAAPLGTRELWVLAGDAQDFCLVLLNPTTLAIAGRREPIAELVARADGAKDNRIAADRRSLLERAENLHIAIFLDRVDTLLPDKATAWTEQAARILGGDNAALAKAALVQLASWSDRYGQDIQCATVGLSIRSTESDLRVGLLARLPATARDIAKQLDSARLLTTLAAGTSSNPRSRQLGEILTQIRVRTADNAVAIQATVPHQLVQTVGEDLRTGLHPLHEQMQRNVMSISCGDRSRRHRVRSMYRKCATSPTGTMRRRTRFATGLTCSCRAARRTSRWSSWCMVAPGRSATIAVAACTRRSRIFWRARASALCCPTIASRRR
jgi:hypothetical protein